MPEDVVTLVRAMGFAARKHREQKRKGEAGEPYVNHVIDVTLRVSDATGGEDILAILGAILHDILEDTCTTEEELTREFGPQVTSLVGELTDDKSLPRATRKQIQVETVSSKSRRAKMIKLADKTSNLISIIESPPRDWDISRRKEYFEWAHNVVLGCRGSNARLEEEFDRAYYRGIDALEEC